MKKAKTLKTLVTFSFIIFLLPFLRTCSDNTIEETNLERTYVSKKTNKTQTEIQEFERVREKKSLEVKKRLTFSFYELIYTTFGEVELKRYNMSIFKDKTFYPLLGFLLILIISILILMGTFFGKYRLTFIFGILNFIVLSLSTIGLFLSDIVVNIDQFKIGYYLFTINSIAIVISAKRLIQNKKKLQTTADWEYGGSIASV